MRELTVQFPRQYVSDFFYLLFWSLRKFNCFQSSTYVFQDYSKRIHEFRYEVCVLLTKERRTHDLSEDRGTYVTLILTLDPKQANEHKVILKLGELETDIGALPKVPPWRKELLRIPRESYIWVQATLQKMVQPKDLTSEEISLVFDSVEKAIKNTVEQISKDPSTEYHITQFFKSYDSFFDHSYRIGRYNFFPAHKSHQGFGDNYICISTISREFTPDSAMRTHFYKLSILGMLLGLICNLHFSICEYAPQLTQKELGIPNFQPCVEPVSKSKLVNFMKEFPEGHFVPLSSEEFRYDNIRLPDDTTVLFEKYFNLLNDKKEAFEESLCCFQMAFDLEPKFPTMSMVSLFSAMERMAEIDKINIEQSATCPRCGFKYDPKCPSCNQQYGIPAARWKNVFEFVKKYLSITGEEERYLKDILEDSYYRIRSAGVHSAKLRGLEYETSEKMRLYLPNEKHFEPSWLTSDYHYRSLKQIFARTLIEWLKKQ